MQTLQTHLECRVPYAVFLLPPTVLRLGYTLLSAPWFALQWLWMNSVDDLHEKQSSLHNNVFKQCNLLLFQHLWVIALTCLLNLHFCVCPHFCKILYQVLNWLWPSVCVSCDAWIFQLHKWPVTDFFSSIKYINCLRAPVQFITFT